MTFLNVLHNLFIHITLNLPTFDIDASDIAFASIVTLPFWALVCSCIVEFTAEPKPLLPVTWEKVARARLKGTGDLWSAVVASIHTNHGKLEGDIWRQFSKIKIEKALSVTLELFPITGSSPYLTGNGQSKGCLTVLLYMRGINPSLFLFSFLVGA